MRYVSCLFLSLALFGTARAATPVAERGSFGADPRLRRTVTVRASRMAVGDFLSRLGATLGVRLAAEGEDVADQRVDLFTHGEPLSAAEILTSIADQSGILRVQYMGVKFNPDEMLRDLQDLVEERR